jgi:hypothetical protein
VRAPQTPQPEPGLGRPAGIAVVVAVQDVLTPVTPLVALSASAVRRADGRPSNWSGGHPGVQASAVHATGVHTTGVIQVSGQPGVRCPRPLRPRCPHHAGSRRSVRRDRLGLAHRVRRVAAAGERRGRCCPNRAWRGRDGRRLVVRGWHERRRQPGRRLAGAQAAAPRWPLGRPGELVQRQVPVGWLGAREQGRAGAPTSPRVSILGRSPACWPTMGLDWEVVTTLGGRCAGGGPVSPGALGPTRFGGEQPAAAARPR